MQIIKTFIAISCVILLAACASKGNLYSESSHHIYAGIDMAQEQLLMQQRTVLFDFDKTDVKPEFLPILAAHARYLRANPQQRLLLAGNTDIRGSREYNLALGEQRANSVAQIMVADGVNPGQLVNMSFGSEVPVNCGQSEQAFTENRRVDLVSCHDKTCQSAAKRYTHETLCSANS